MPVNRQEWMPPSLWQPKNIFGHAPVEIFWRVRARISDGFVVWTGIFRDRDDVDAFLWAIASGTIKRDRQLWKLCAPEWHPGLGDNVVYDFATVTLLTTTGSNQTYSKPSDWNNSNNTVEVIGGGGSGGSSSGSTLCSNGGGGGGYGRSANLSIAASTTYNVGATAAGVSSTSGSATNGNAGNSSWWNSTTFAGSTPNASGGGAGKAATNAAGVTAASGGTGTGTAATATGGGSLTQASGPFSNRSSGGGGAAGKYGSGVSSTGNDGGNGDASFGGNGGAAYAAGSTGVEYGIAGSGGGGGNSDNATTAGAGGNYGGGGGSAGRGPFTGNSGAGAQGLIVVTYGPVGQKSLANANIPMLGL